MKYVWILALLLTAAPTLFAKDDGNELLNNCTAVVNTDEHPDQENANNLERSLRCLILVRAVANTVAIWKASDELAKVKSTLRPCVPDTVGTMQAVRVIVKYLNDHPE